jgi:hypothetical protein
MEELGKFAFWHIWEGWQFALWLGIGSGMGSLFGHHFLYKKSWKHSIFSALFMAIFVGGIMLLIDYYRFLSIWEDVMINGNY